MHVNLDEDRVRETDGATGTTYVSVCMTRAVIDEREAGAS